MRLTANMLYISDKVYNSKVSRYILAKYDEAIIQHHNGELMANKRMEDEPCATYHPIDYLKDQRKAYTDYMANNPHIVISNSDKGGKTVICKRNTMENKVKQFVDKQLSDGVYEKVGVSS